MKNITRGLEDAWSRLMPGSTVFCAVSGGIDSMVLLEASVEYRRVKDPARRLVVLHVNHNLRGAESDSDEEFVRGACARLQLPVDVLRIEWGTERPSQASCRRRREMFFREKLRPEDRLFLAHHLNDQAETVLQRLLRGTGVRGIAGMRFESGLKLRPFLGISRAEIEAYARQRGICWREDSSNLSLKYERNWLRQEVMPLLEKRRPGLAQKLAALAEEAAALDFSAPEIEFFALGENWRFYHGMQLRRASSGQISESLRLSRIHTRGLTELLRKGAGRYQAEGVGFRLSAGILLAEKAPFAPISQFSPCGDAITVQNALGRWDCKVKPGEMIGPASTLALGDKAKKEFQRHRVPTFFRELVPLLVSGGKPRALLPLGNELATEIEWSALGRWWWQSQSNRE